MPWGTFFPDGILREAHLNGRKREKGIQAPPEPSEMQFDLQSNPVSGTKHDGTELIRVTRTTTQIDL
jgi:hypothetical protein